MSNLISQDETDELRGAVLAGGATANQREYSKRTEMLGKKFDRKVSTYFVFCLPIYRLGKMLETDVTVGKVATLYQQTRPFYSRYNLNGQK